MERFAINIFTEVENTSKKLTNTHRYYGTGFHESKAFVKRCAESIMANLPSDETVVKAEMKHEVTSVEPITLNKRGGLCLKF